MNIIEVGIVVCISLTFVNLFILGFNLKLYTEILKDQSMKNRGAVK